MPFYHDKTYHVLQLEEQEPNGHKILWILRGDFNGDFVAGVTAAIYILLNDKVINYGGKYNHLVSVHINDSNDSTYIPVGDHHNYYEAMQHYVGHIGISPDNIKNYQAPPNGFAWWLKNIDVYDMYIFTDPEFIQGFISVCDAFNVEFRDYIAGPPFRYNALTLQNEPYVIDGYDIAPFRPITRVPASPAPYYIMADEADLYAANYV